MLLILALLHFCSAWAVFDLFPSGSSSPYWIGDNRFTLNNASPYEVSLRQESWNNRFVEIMLQKHGHEKLGCEYSLTVDGALLMDGTISVGYSSSDADKARNMFQVLIRPGMVPVGAQKLVITSTCTFNRYAHVLSPNAINGDSFVYDLRRETLSSGAGHVFEPHFIDGAELLRAEVPFPNPLEDGSFIAYMSNESPLGDTSTDSTMETGGFWSGTMILDISNLLLEAGDVPVLQINFMKASESRGQVKISYCSDERSCQRASLTHFDELIAELYVDDNDFQGTGFATGFVGLEKLMEVPAGQTMRFHRILIECGSSLNAATICFPYVKVWNAANKVGVASPSLLDLRWSDDGINGAYVSTLAVTHHGDCSHNDIGYQGVNGNYGGLYESGLGAFISCEWNSSPTGCQWGREGATFSRPAGPVWVEATFPDTWKSKDYPVIEFGTFGSPIEAIPCTGGADYTGAMTLSGFTLSTATKNYFSTPDYQRETTSPNAPSGTTYQVSFSDTTTGHQDQSRFRFEAFASPDAASIKMHAFALIYEAPPSCSPTTCLNGGTCVPGFSGSFECMCTDRWSGPTCAVAHACATNPCENGGMCMEEEFAGTSEANCFCTAGWMGDLCDTRISQYIEDELTSIVLGETYKVVDTSPSVPSLEELIVDWFEETSTLDPLIEGYVRQELALTEPPAPPSIIQRMIQAEVARLLNEDLGNYYPTRNQMNQEITQATLNLATVQQTQALVSSQITQGGYQTEDDLRSSIAGTLQVIEDTYITYFNFNNGVTGTASSFVSLDTLNEEIASNTVTFVGSRSVNQRIAYSSALLSDEFMQLLDNESLSSEEVDIRIRDSLTAARIGVLDLQDEVSALDLDIVETCSDLCVETDSTCVRYNGVDHCVYVDVLNYSAGSSLLSAWSFFVLIGSLLLAFV